MRAIAIPVSPLAALALACMANTAAAQEYCIACTEPQAVYRCVISDVRPGDSQPLQLLCVSTMAKEGGHASCSVRRGTVFDCDGQIKKVSAVPGPAKATEPAAPDRDAKQQPKQPPQTVEQLARQVARSSGEQVEKAGESVRSGARKAWNCLTSFFKSC